MIGRERQHASATACMHLACLPSCPRRQTKLTGLRRGQLQLCFLSWPLLRLPLAAHLHNHLGPICRILPASGLPCCTFSYEKNLKTFFIPQPLKAMPPSAPLLSAGNMNACSPSSSFISSWTHSNLAFAPTIPPEWLSQSHQWPLPCKIQWAVIPSSGVIQGCHSYAVWTTDLRHTQLITPFYLDHILRSLWGQHRFPVSLSHAPHLPTSLYPLLVPPNGKYYRSFKSLSTESSFLIT